jgi:DNA-directed RNA polymerase specialized sigma24 family protein
MDAEELEEEKEALREIEARALEVIRSTTKEQTWKMFWMRVVEKVPYPEIAKQFGVSEAAVRMAKQRVVKRLKGLGFEM